MAADDARNVEDGTGPGEAQPLPGAAPGAAPSPDLDDPAELEFQTLLARLTALERTVGLAEGRLRPVDLAPARDLLDRADARLATARTHTVVAFGGATGSGKSSLFNALAGLDLSPVGAQRPTTATAIACTWDPDGARPLLDLLGLPRARQVPRHSVLDEDLPDGLPPGLVLVDLPDHDSVEDGHRAEVDRWAAAADHLVWVLDPQKYADAAAHDRYLRPLAPHGAVLTVVLNQVDRLPHGAVEQCLADVRRLLAEDGLPDVRILAVSTRTGQGVEDLRAVVGALADSRRAAVVRVAADLDRTVAGLRPLFGGDGPEPEAPAVAARPGRELLVAGVAEAAGTDAVAASTARRPGRPVMPLGLRTARERERPAVPVPAGLPWAVPVEVGVQPHRVELAVRQAAQQLGRGLPEPWAAGVRRSLAPGLRALPATLGGEAEPKTGASPKTRAPGPGGALRAVAAVQWLGVALALVGLVGSVAALAGAHLPGRALGVPGPTWLVFAGLLLVLVSALAGPPLAARADRRRSATTGADLRTRVAVTTEELLVSPAVAELERYREARATLAAAAGEEGIRKNPQE